MVVKYWTVYLAIIIHKFVERRIDKIFTQTQIRKINNMDLVLKVHNSRNAIETNIDTVYESGYIEWVRKGMSQIMFKCSTTVYINIH